MAFNVHLCYMLLIPIQPPFSLSYRFIILGLDHNIPCSNRQKFELCVQLNHVLLQALAFIIVSIIVPSNKEKRMHGAIFIITLSLM